MRPGSGERPRIVIVGGGFAGATCARRLERLLAPDEAEVVLLDRNNFFVFTPLLVEAGTGALEPRHAVVAIRAFLSRTRFIMGEAEALDTERGLLRYRPPENDAPRELAYDQLVLALGSVTRVPEVPGLSEHGFELKSLADAVTLRDRAIRLLERADVEPDAEARRRLLHIVIVGANYTGVEVAGELQIFLRRASRRYSLVDPDDIRVTLVELGDRILPALDRDLAAYARRHLERRGLKIELGTTVDLIGPGEARLADGRTVATETVIWCAGIAPAPLVGALDLPTDDNGYIRCERDLRVVGHDRVWAVGDSAVNPGPDGVPYPATAQHAVRQGEHLARNLVGVLRGEPARPCDITAAGALAALGCRTGVAKVFGLKLSGFAAWFLWRTVYLAKMPGLSRKLRVALDWTMDLFFPRDAVQLGLTRGRERAGNPPGP